MIFRFFKNCDDFLKYYFNNDMDYSFELVREQIEKDQCYLDDNWIQRCVVELETNSGVEPIATIGFNKNKDFNSDHITTFEVSRKYRSMGFGSIIMNTFINEYCKMPRVTLYAEDKNRNFYEKLGFVRDTSVSRFFYKKEKI